MASGLATPVAVGLALGIGFVVLFSISIQQPLVSDAPPMTDISNDSSKVDKPISLTGKGDKTVVETILTVDVGGEPKQISLETGKGSSLMTTYLPVNLTQTIPLENPTETMILYPIFTDWDGIVRSGSTRLFDENNNRISYSGGGTQVLHVVNATCTEPYFVRVTESDLGEDGINIVNTTAPTYSRVAWGDTFGMRLSEPQSGVIHYQQTAGIVPADYNNQNDDTYRNNGAGSQEVAGIYHLSFTSFYPSTVNLPEQAELTSSFEAKCTINEDSVHVEKSDFLYIYVYDIWFKMSDS